MSEFITAAKLLDAIRILKKCEVKCKKHPRRKVAYLRMVRTGEGKIVSQTGLCRECGRAK